MQYFLLMEKIMGSNQLKILNYQTCVSPFLDLEKSLMLAGAELDEERKIPLKLRRRGDLGGESWWEDSGRGKTVLGDPGLVLGQIGAETGVQGWLTVDLKHGLAESLLSPCGTKVNIFIKWTFRVVDEKVDSSCVPNYTIYIYTIHWFIRKAVIVVCITISVQHSTLRFVYNMVSSAQKRTIYSIWNLLTHQLYLPISFEVWDFWI